MSLTKGTDKFDARLKILQRAAPMYEQKAAIALYERLRTARAIAESLLTEPSSADVVAVFCELCSDSRAAAVLEDIEFKSINTTSGAD